MTTFASTTTVPPEKSRSEIERLVTKYGASRFVSGWEEKSAAVLFEMKGRRVRFSLPMPDPKDRRFTHGKSSWTLPATKQKALLDQAVRSSWRALLLVIKAKLEAVETGITTFEDEFLAHLVLPNGQTVGEWAIPMIAEAYDKGINLPPMLPAGPR
jgi:hypothetical protein